MANYLMKYKGQYRILPEIDLKTNDIPRDKDGEVADGYDDLYISCQNGNKIYAYGADENNSKLIYLVGYIPSIGRGRNITKELKKQKVEYFDYLETDAEIEFKFKAKDIEPVAKLMKARTSGASISPFSNKNLGKNKDIKLPEEEMDRYKQISSKVQKGDALLIHRITTRFLDDILTKECKKKDKLFDLKADMKKLCLSRQVKEYIYTKNLFDEYLEYLDEEISKHYNS